MLSYKHTEGKTRTVITALRQGRNIIHLVDFPVHVCLDEIFIIIIGRRSVVDRTLPFYRLNVDPSEQVNLRISGLPLPLTHHYVLNKNIRNYRPLESVAA